MFAYPHLPFSGRTPVRFTRTLRALLVVVLRTTAVPHLFVISTNCSAYIKIGDQQSKTDSLRPARGEKDSYHLPGMALRYSIVTTYLMEPGELGKVRPTTLLRFARATKTFSCPLVVLVLRIGPNVSTRPQLWLSAPKAKVKISHSLLRDVRVYLFFFCNRTENHNHTN